MKRIWFGGALLVILLLAGIAGGSFLRSTQQFAAEQLQQLRGACDGGIWQQTREMTHRLQSEWAQRRILLSALVDHTVLEQIDLSFAQLRYYAQTEDASAFGGSCVYLAVQLEALGAGQLLSLENLL